MNKVARLHKMHSFYKCINNQYTQQYTYDSKNENNTPEDGSHSGSETSGSSTQTTRSSEENFKLNTIVETYKEQIHKINNFSILVGID